MNSYAVLGIDKDASNKDIIQATALAMRQRRHDARTIAQAQKKLLDPVSRACQAFIYFFDFEDAKKRLGLELDEILASNEKTEGCDCFGASCLKIFDGHHG